MKKAIVSTSGNPFHYGHLDIFNKAKEIFDEVKIIIAQNSEKKINNDISYHMNAYNVPYEIIHDETIADYCFKNEITHIIRGIRNGVDAEYELKLDFANKEINPKIQTIFIPTSDVYSNISSSTIRELLRYKKYDIVKKYMNEDAMYRYVNGKKYIVFFGKSCVGKSTYLNNENINAINVDTYLWEISEKVFGKYKTYKFKEDSKHLIYSDKFTSEEKLKILNSYDTKFFTEDFWNEFFSINNTKYLDWASVGIYYDLIPVKYRSMMEFIEVTCDDNLRYERIKSKNFESKIKYLDNLYLTPKIIDGKIKVS